MSQIKKTSIILWGSLIVIILLVFFLVILIGESVTGVIKSVDDTPPDIILDEGGDDLDPVENLYEDLCGIGMTACDPVTNSGLPSEPIIERTGDQGFDDELEPISDSNEYPPL